MRERLFVVGRDGTGLTEVAPDWERFAEPVGFHPDGRVVVSADDEAHHRLFAIDLQTNEVQAICDSPLTVGAVVRGATGWTGVLHGMLRAPEAFLLPFDQTVPTVLTAITADKGDLSALATVEDLTVDSKDGTSVHYWLLVPKGTERPAKTLLWIHGGPMGAFNDGWHWRWNVGVPLAQGYAMALPNPRGSTGFGQRFIEEIWGNRYGAECFDDVMAVTDAVAADPRIDGTRMAAMGGSFGGYMTNWIGGNTGTRFRCLVTHASLYDFPRFYGVTDHPGFWSLKMGLAPWDDPEEFSRYSPHTRIRNWKSPTLVIHGERDYRVPVGEGLALFEALQANGVDSELLAYPDENHWILKPRNIAAWYDTFLAFVAKHLGQ